MSDFSNKFGDWAIVTGASSGIGKEFANQLAKKGINLFLLARRVDLLKELSIRLESKHSIKVKYARIDLTDNNFLEQIIEKTNGLKIGLVISNAGGARMGAFNKIPMSDLENMLQLNVKVHMKLSHWFTSLLLQENRQGGLLLISSTTAFQGVPFASNYAAAKAYVLNLGEALNFELKNKGIHVTVLIPGPTDTPGLTDNDDANMIDHLPAKPQPVDKLVKEGLNAIIKNKPTQIGSRMNRIMSSVMKTFMSRNGATSFWGKMMFKMVNLK